jgi:prevent-host-death family protein
VRLVGPGWLVFHLLTRQGGARGSPNSRNSRLGTRARRAISDVGPIQISSSLLRVGGPTRTVTHASQRSSRLDPGSSSGRLTGDTLLVMAQVTIRELRNHGGEVVDRVQAGEHVVITRSGKPVAELRPVEPPGLDARTLLARWRNLPPVDPERFRLDLDAVIDPEL